MFGITLFQVALSHSVFTRGKNFIVKLKLGEEVYEGKASKIQTAKHLAAVEALKHTKLNPKG